MAAPLGFGLEGVGSYLRLTRPTSEHDAITGAPPATEDRAAMRGVWRTHPNRELLPHRVTPFQTARTLKPSLHGPSVQVYGPGQRTAPHSIQDLDKDRTAKVPGRVSKGACTVSDFVRMTGTVIALTVLLAACAASDSASPQLSSDPQAIPSEKLSTQELEDRIRSAAEKVQDMKRGLQRPSPVSGATPLERGAASLGDSLGKVILRQRLEQARKRLQADVNELRKRRTQSLMESEMAYLEAIRARVHPDIYPLFELAVLRGFL